MAGEPFFPRKIYATVDTRSFPLTRKILEKLGHVPFEWIEKPEEAADDLLLSPDPIAEGKSSLLLTTQRGAWIKPCPCTPRYVGCGYKVINSDLNCPLDCSYCILQLYLDHPMITVHVNTRELWSQLDTFLVQNRKKGIRMGTGELGDSLALDHITERTGEFLDYFRERPDVLFELKTKTANIENLLERKPPPNVVLAWSLNSREAAEREEPGAVEVSRRIQAARRAVRAGYRVAFHFDPLIHYPGWEGGYSEVVDELLDQVDPRKAAWISLGCLRFPASLRGIIRKRFPASTILGGEFIRGRDGKCRYPAPLRIRLLGRVVQRIRRKGGKDIPVYFCMESREIWERVLGKKTRGKEEVERLLTLPLVGFDG